MLRCPAIWHVWLAFSKVGALPRATTASGSTRTGAECRRYGHRDSERTLAPPEIINAEGVVVARHGDTIILVGGYVAVDPSIPCMIEQDRAFHVHQISSGRRH